MRRHSAVLDIRTKDVLRYSNPYMNAENAMSYRTRAGRQFVLVSTGAGADAALVAFTLDAK